MATLTSLPRELRQQIFLTAVQDEHLIGGTWPKTLNSLLQTCHLFRYDIPWVLNSWTPPWTLQKPADLKFLKTSTIDGRPTIHHIRINIFHEVCIDSMKKPDWLTESSRVLQPELVLAWIEAVSLLPKECREVLLDITPAPGWLRRPHQMYQVNELLLDNRISRCFMGDRHVPNISALIQHIHERFAGKIRVNLTGTLCMRSERFMVGVLARCQNVPVEWIGEYITREQSAGVQFQRIVHSLAPKRRTRDICVEDWQRALTLAPLRKVRWSDKSIKLFAEICSEENVDELREEIRELAELTSGKPGEVVKRMPITEIGDFEIGGRGGNLERISYENLRKAFTHSLARDMGFKTASKGIDETRHVVITRREKT
jgi:hypothetical protein